MNVIIRLQNLPWSANALDIRQFFKGLSIPDGGVHIVGGEMGDAFIAFSTDEDARQAMMHDRDAINGVQVRLLLSSRAEMQKVIETARQQSLRALQNTADSITVAPPKGTPPSIASTLTMATNPQPPVITPNSLHCILSNSLSSVTPSFLAYQQQAGITLMPKAALNNNTLNNVESNISPKLRDYHSNSRERRSRSPSCSRSRSKEQNSTRRRRERSRERSKDREGTIGVRRRSGRSRDRSYERSRSRSRERSPDRGRERSRNSYHNNRDSKNRSRDRDAGKSKSNISTWNQNTKSIYGTQKTDQGSVVGSNVSEDSNTIQKSLTSMNNYSLNSFLGRSNNNMGFAFQNPYTAASNTISSSDSTNNLTTTSSSAIPGIFVEKKSDEIASTSSQSVTETTLLQDSIVFADTNPYEKMYPKLFAQAASIGTVSAKPSVLNKSAQSSPISPKEDDPKSREVDSYKTRCVKIMNMCPGTTYSDIRKFCVGLYIPHNGIKMVNDVHGLRVGVAYIQFSKNACVARVLSRNNHLLRNKAVIIQAVSEEEFENVMDSFHPDNRDKSYFGGRGEYNSNTSDGQQNSSNPFKNQSATEPFNVLYIEDIPSLTTEHDIMKMFSSYSLYDILLMPSPENRREFVAHVRFSREEDALLAFEDKAHHQIGYRRLRVWPGSVEEMDRAKEKIRLANEQLMKEEQEAAEEEVQRKQYEEKARIKNRKEVVSLDLTQSDGEGGDDMEDGEDFIDSTNKLIDNVVKNDDDSNCEDRYDFYKGRDNPTDTDTRNYNGDLPNPFDVEPVSNSPSVKVNDPRLRKAMRGTQPGNSSNTVRANKDSSNINNFNPNFNDQQSPSHTINSIEHNFVILKNCDYNTRINDVAQLLITANLALKHIEPLHNERQLPTGEFIVEFRRTQDTEVAVKRFHNIEFMSRSLRVFPITPQEIADRLAKPFLGYIPGGNGIKISDLKTLAAAMNVGQMNNASNMDYNGGNGHYPGRCGSSNRFDDIDTNDCNNEGDDFNENNNDNGLPDRFLRPGCVLELENLPYKAQLNDILNFFKGFNLKPDDIIRRFNDNGHPTGDARVAFDSPEDARKALEARRRNQMFNRTVYLNIL